MAQTPPPSITPLPPAPSTSDPTNFDSEADAFVAAQQPWGTQVSALGQNVYDNAVDAYNNAQAAAGSAAAAATTANTTVWVSGATVAQYAKVMDPLDSYRTYLRKTATGSGVTNPAADPTNYQLVSLVPAPVMKVSHRLSNGTSAGAGTSGAWNTRVLNTTEYNDITGASLGSNAVTLPAGTYDVVARAPSYNGGQNQAAVYNSTDSANLVLGSNSGTGGAGNNIMSDSMVRGRFTISATKTVILRHWVAAGSATNALGFAVSAGSGEVYSEMTFTKVA